MVRDCLHVVHLKRNFARAVITSGQTLSRSETGISEALVDRVVKNIVQVLFRLEGYERGFLELIYGLGDGHTYSSEETAQVFGMLPEHIPFEEGRILGKCWQILEHIGI